MVLVFDPIRFFLFSILKFFLGLIWYSPSLFGDTWMEEAKICHEEIDEMKQSGKIVFLYLTQFFLQSFSLFIHYQLLIWYNQIMIDSLYFTLLLFIGFIIPSFFESYMWESKSMKVFIINSGYNLFAMMFFLVFIFLFEDEIR